jgi:hypothetical protein
MTARIHLTIDEVWMDGVTPAADLSELLTKELHALLLRPEVLSTLQALPDVEVDRIDGGKLTSGVSSGSRDARSAQLGSELAAAVTRSLLGVGLGRQTADVQPSLSSGVSGFGSKEQP